MLKQTNGLWMYVSRIFFGSAVMHETPIRKMLTNIQVEIIDAITH